VSDDRSGKLIAKLGPRRLARALLSPWALAAGLGVVGALIASGQTAAGLLGGVVAWAAGVLWSLRGSKSDSQRAAEQASSDRIDPFAVGEPWRRYVQSSQSARTRFASAIDRSPSGPLRDRLESIGERINEAAQEIWVIAKDGHALNGALKAINVTEISRRVTAATAQLQGAAPERLPSLQASLDSALARQQSAQRLTTQRTALEDRLRELDGKLDELSARGVELSVSGSTSDADPSLDSLRSDVDNVIIEMEALRQAMAETGTLAKGGRNSGTPSVG
jgi:HPt (histidine-containing phosphotransfer) domain-containing protein